MLNTIQMYRIFDPKSDGLLHTKDQQQFLSHIRPSQYPISMTRHRPDGLLGRHQP